MPVRLGFHTKLMLVTIAIVLVTIVCLTLMQAVMTRQGYRDKGRAALDGVATTLHEAVTLQDSLNQQKIRADLDVLTTQFELSGFPVPEPLMEIEIRGPVAESADRGVILVPGFRHGRHYLHENTELVDKVAALTGSVITVLQRHEERLLRISTSLPTAAGWEQGSAVHKGHPAYEAVMLGEDYVGQEQFGHVWHHVGMTPIHDLGGEVIGALEVSRPLISADFAAFVRTVSVGQGGGSFALDRNLIPAIAPLRDSGFRGAITLDTLEEMAGNAPASLTMDDGRIVDVVTRYYAPWDMFFISWVAEEDLMQGVNSQLIRSALFSAGLPLALSLVLIWITGRQLLGPIRRLARMSSRVADGDFDFQIDYRANDDLGQTIAALRRMVDDLKHKLGFGKGVLEGVVIPCIVVDTENNISHVNQAALDVLGHSGVPADHIGRNMGEFAFSDARRLTLTQKAMNAGQQLEDEITLTHRQLGICAHLRVVVTPIHDLDEALIGAMAIWIDLTDEKARQTQIKMQNEVMARAAGDAGHISRKVSDASTELTGLIHASSTGAANQQSRALLAVDAMEQMTSSLAAMAEKAQSSAQLARQAVARAEHGNAVVQDSMQVMTEVADQARTLRNDLVRLGTTASNIGGIMSMVEEIADQTNLLALNAAIEAARAGTAGRGFAVVADEVRKLAEKTMLATREVDGIIGQIQTQIRENVHKAESTNTSMNRCAGLVNESGAALGSIVEIVSTTAQQIEDISHSVNAQQTSGQRIRMATDDMAAIAKDNARAMHESSQAVVRLDELARELLNVIASMEGPDHSEQALDDVA